MDRPSQDRRVHALSAATGLTARGALGHATHRAGHRRRSAEVAAASRRDPLAHRESRHRLWPVRIECPEVAARPRQPPRWSGGPLRVARIRLARAGPRIPTAVRAQPGRVASPLPFGVIRPAACGLRRRLPERGSRGGGTGAQPAGFRGFPQCGRSCRHRAREQRQHRPRVWCLSPRRTRVFPNFGRHPTWALFARLHQATQASHDPGAQILLRRCWRGEHAGATGMHRAALRAVRQGARRIGSFTSSPPSPPTMCPISA